MLAAVPDGTVAENEGQLLALDPCELVVFDGALIEVGPEDDDALYPGVYSRALKFVVQSGGAPRARRATVSSLLVIQRQLGHADLGITSAYLRGIDNTEIIHAVHERPAPMIPAVLGH